MSQGTVKRVLPIVALFFAPSVIVALAIWDVDSRHDRESTSNTCIVFANRVDYLLAQSHGSTEDAGRWLAQMEGYRAVNSLRKRLDTCSPVLDDLHADVVNVALIHLTKGNQK